MASRTESEIWSATLSGWPSETDSDVNRNSLFIGVCPTVAQPDILAKTVLPKPAPAVKFLLRPLALLPLAANHAIGAFLGRLVYMVSPRYRRRLLENLSASGLVRPGDVRRVAWENAAEIGKSATELAWGLFRPLGEVVAIMSQKVGWEEVERLRAANRPILFVTPHLGGYDLA